MPKVIADISMSLDGFVTGPDPDAEHALGHGGEVLHTWAIDSDDPVDAEILRTSTAGTGAVIMGRRLFDIVDAPTGWSDEMGYGAREAGRPAIVVLTHSPPRDVRLDLQISFAGGLADAVEQARAAAGDKDVVVMGGADVVRQSVESGAADELRIHLAPVVLGGGLRLFGAVRAELTPTSSVASRHATHLTYALR